jgi:hypothetical protein
MSTSSEFVRAVDFVGMPTRDLEARRHVLWGNAGADPNPVALHVDDVTEVRRALEQRGVQFQGDILDTGVCHMAFFSDPDGNALMLHRRYAPRVTE